MRSKLFQKVLDAVAELVDSYEDAIVSVTLLADGTFIIVNKDGEVLYCGKE